MSFVQEIKSGVSGAVHDPKKHKLLLYGGVVIAAFLVYWFFLRNFLSGLGSGSTAANTQTAAGVPVAGGGGGGTVNRGPVGPAGPRGKQGKQGKPGKSVPVNRKGKQQHHGNTPVHIRLPNHGKMHHPVAPHGHAPGQPPSRRSFLEALGVIKRKRKQVTNLRELKVQAAKSHNVRYEHNLRARIRRDRKAIRPARQTVIAFRHEPKKTAHPIPGRKQGGPSRVKAA